MNETRSCCLFQTGKLFKSKVVENSLKVNSLEKIGNISFLGSFFIKRECVFLRESLAEWMQGEEFSFGHAQMKV